MVNKESTNSIKLLKNANIWYLNKIMKQSLWKTWQKNTIAIGTEIENIQSSQ